MDGESKQWQELKAPGLNRACVLVKRERMLKYASPSRRRCTNVSICLACSLPVGCNGHPQGLEHSCGLLWKAGGGVERVYGDAPLPQPLVCHRLSASTPTLKRNRSHLSRVDQYAALARQLDVGGCCRVKAVAIAAEDCAFT